MLPVAVAVDVSEPGLEELSRFCRAATGLDGSALDALLSQFDGADASMMLALREALGAMEPTAAAPVLRHLLRYLRDSIGLVPLDTPLDDEPPAAVPLTRSQTSLRAFPRLTLSYPLAMYPRSRRNSSCPVRRQPRATGRNRSVCAPR